MQYCLHHAYPKEPMKRRTVLKLAADGAALAALGGISPLVFGAAPLKELRLDYAYYSPASLVLRRFGWLEDEFKADGTSVRWVLSAGSNLLFAWLGTRGHDVNALIFVISADNLSSGIASAAFIAYLSSLTNVNYSATQYALFSSMMLLLPKFLAGFSGEYVDTYGYTSFFTATALLGLPVLVLVAFASRQKVPPAQ
jgi:hypothetical protein